MGIAKKAADAYTLFKKAKKIKGYVQAVKQSVDENTRPGGLLKLGIKATLEVAGKALGVSLTSHPYFTYHKAHIEVLATALNASSNFDKAQEALNGAIRSADASAALTKSLGDYQTRKNGLKLVYSTIIAGSLTTLRNYRTDPQTAADLRDSGTTPESLQSSVDQSIYEWRATYCDLYLDSLELLAMAQTEFRVTEAAMKRFDEKMKALKKTGSFGTIFGAKVEEERQWQEFDRMTKPGTGSEKAVEDPAGYARDQVDSIETVANKLGDGCEAAMSDAAYDPQALLLRIGNL